MYYLHSEAKAKRLRLRLYREKGELELVVWYVAVLISDLSQHCVLRGPKRRGLTEAARLLLVVVRGRGYHDITLGLTLKISFEYFSLGNSLKHLNSLNQDLSKYGAFLHS